MLTWKEVLSYAENGAPKPERTVVKSEPEWRESLTAEQFRVARQSGTEHPFSHPMCQKFEPGIYRCVCCGEHLFDSREKFDSGTGWPSFTQPLKPNTIAYHADQSHGMVRVEVTCNCCAAHLGHVFPDGPPPTGLRYCINGIAMEKVHDVLITPVQASAPTSRLGVDDGSSKDQKLGPEDVSANQAASSDKHSHDSHDSHDSPAPSSLEQATFGGGCFWCTEAIFQRVQGVHRVESGYSGGETDQPNYEEVCSERTGHAEVIQVTYDPAAISFQDLVAIHLSTHDPTTLNRQGADTGTQYRSVVFYSSPEERDSARMVIAACEQAIGKRVVTAIEPFERFYPAEPTHQDYFNRNRLSGYCAAVIEPKLAHFRKSFSHLMI